jgi:hypothetical protein
LITHDQVIPKPGEHGGPCRRLHCGHEECELMRSYSRKRCTICGEAIGFDQLYLGDTTDEDFAPSELTHSLCAAAREARSPTT